MFWKKKQQPEPKKIVFTCNHKWKDFPWIVEGSYDRYNHSLHIKITEPFICIHCKERKDVILEEGTYYKENQETANKYLNEIVEKYDGYCELRPIVEDMIADFQLVDRKYLELASIVMSQGNIPKPSLKGAEDKNGKED